MPKTKKAPFTLFGQHPLVSGGLIVAGLIIVGTMLATHPSQRPVEETVAGVTTLQYPVNELPGGNLLKNPWFANGDCSGPSMGYWTSVPNDTDHRWTASDKPTNPSPLSGCATAARISVGEMDGTLAATVQPNKDVSMYQIVGANPDNKTLVFNMYWVTHTMNKSVVAIYGGDSNDPNGSWTKVWTPFNYSVKNTLVPPSSVADRVTWLWKCYSEHLSECGNAPKLPATTTLSKGYPYYKVEFLANLPPVTGGYKLTGVYFSSVASPDAVPAFGGALGTGPVTGGGTGNTGGTARVKPSPATGSGTPRPVASPKTR